MANTHADPSEVRLYQTAADLSPALWDDLDSRKQADVSFRTGLPFDPNTGYRASFLGVDYEINPATRKITIPGKDRAPSFQAGLVLMTYLANASEEGLSGRMVTERELNGGEMFFKGPHVLNKVPVIERFGRDARPMLKIADTWGATEMQGGDAAFRLLVLPKILVGVTLYEGDDEFPAELTVTFDANSDKHLPLDGLWAMINVLSNRLARGALA